MDVKEKKLDLIDWLLHVNDETMIERLYELKTNSTKDWYDELPESAKKSIQKGLKDIEEGNILTHEEVTKKLKEKYAFLK